MLSETLSKGLAEYAIGPKLRALRLKKKMGLVELGRHSGLSPALLSKIERGKLIPTLPTLLRVALVFSVGLEHFFTEPSPRPVLAVIRKRDRLRFPDQAGARAPQYQFESLDYAAVDRRMSAYAVEFENVDAGRARPHAHPGAEFLYLLAGALIVTVGGEAHRLAAGDAMYFDSSVPHSYVREGRQACRALVVTA